MSFLFLLPLMFYSGLSGSGASVDSAGKGYIVRVSNNTSFVGELTIDGTTLKMAPGETLGSFTEALEKVVQVVPIVAIEMKTHLSEATNLDSATLAKYGIVRNPGRVYGQGTDAQGSCYDGILAKTPSFSGYSITPVSGLTPDAVVILAPMQSKGLARMLGFDIFKTSPQGLTFSCYVYSADEADFALVLAKDDDNYIKINLSSKPDNKGSIVQVAGTTSTTLDTGLGTGGLSSGNFTKVWFSVTKTALFVGTGTPGTNVLMSARLDCSAFGQLGFLTDSQAVFLTYLKLQNPLAMFFGGSVYAPLPGAAAPDKKLALREKGIGAIKVDGFAPGKIILTASSGTVECEISSDSKSLDCTIKPASGDPLEKKFVMPDGAGTGLVINLFAQEVSFGVGSGLSYEFVGSLSHKLVDGLTSVDWSAMACTGVEIVNYGQWLCKENAAVSGSLASASLEIKKYFNYQVVQDDQAVTVVDTFTKKSFVLEKCPQQGAIYPFEFDIAADGTPTITLYNSIINPQKYALGIGGAILRVAELAGQTYAQNMIQEKQAEIKVDVAVTVQSMGVLLGAAAVGSAAAALEALNTEGFRNSKDAFVYQDKFNQQNVATQSTQSVTDTKQTVSQLIEKLSLLKYNKTDDIEYATNLIGQILSSLVDERSLASGTGNSIKATFVDCISKMVAYAHDGLLKATKATNPTTGMVTFGPANHDVFIDLVIDTMSKILDNKLLFDLDQDADLAFAKTIYKSLTKCCEFKFLKFIFQNANFQNVDAIIAAQSAKLVSAEQQLAAKDKAAAAPTAAAPPAVAINPLEALLAASLAPPAPVPVVPISADPSAAVTPDPSAATPAPASDPNAPAPAAGTPPAAPAQLLFSDSRGSFYTTGLSFDTKKVVSKKLVDPAAPSDSSGNNAQEMVDQVKVEFDLTLSGGQFSVAFAQALDPQGLGPFKTGDPIFQVVFQEDCLNLLLSKEGRVVVSDQDSDSPDVDARPSPATSKRYSVTFSDGQVQLFLLGGDTPEQLLIYKDPYYQELGQITPGFFVGGQAMVVNVNVECNKIVSREFKFDFPHNADPKSVVFLTGPDTDFYTQAKAKYDAIVALSVDDSSALELFDAQAGNQILSASGVGLDQTGVSLGDTYGTIDDADADFQSGSALEWTAKDAALSSRSGEESQSEADKQAAATALAAKNAPKVSGGVSANPDAFVSDRSTKGQTTGTGQKLSIQGAQALMGEVQELGQMKKDIFGGGEATDAYKKALKDGTASPEELSKLKAKADEEKASSRWNLKADKVPVTVTDENGEVKHVVKDKDGNIAHRSVGDDGKAKLEEGDEEEKEDSKENILQRAFRTGRTQSGTGADAVDMNKKSVFIAQAVQAAAEIGSIKNVGQKASQIKSQFGDLTKKSDAESDAKVAEGTKSAHAAGRNFDKSAYAALAIKGAEGLMNAGKDTVNDDEKAAADKDQAASVDLSAGAALN